MSGPSDSALSLPSALSTLRRTGCGEDRYATSTSNVRARPGLVPRVDTDPEVFFPASDALQEIITRSSLAGGAGVNSLTLPLLVKITRGPQILPSSVSRAFACLL